VLYEEAAKKQAAAAGSQDAGAQGPSPKGPPPEGEVRRKGDDVIDAEFEAKDK